MCAWRLTSEEGEDGGEDGAEEASHHCIGPMPSSSSSSSFVLGKRLPHEFEIDKLGGCTRGVLDNHLGGVGTTGLDVEGTELVVDGDGGSDLVPMSGVLFDREDRGGSLLLRV